MFVSRLRLDRHRICTSVCQSALLFCVSLVAASAFAADTPEQLLNQAKELERNGNLLRAVESYKQFLTEYPDNTQLIEAHYQLGKCYDGLGQIEESISYLKLVTESKDGKFRNRTQAFHLLGRQHGSLKQYKEAVAVFETLLGEGAGLYEDEVLNLSGGYYAILGQTDEAAAKFNILKRKKESPLAQDAAYKLCVLWLKNEQLDPVIESIQDLANAFPQHKRIPELLLRAADLFRRSQQFNKSVALCEQLKTRYPKNVESVAGHYLIGLSLRDQKKFAEAVAVFDEVGRDKRFQREGLAAEALLESADIHLNHLSDTDEAMQRYDDAAALARESDSDRTPRILEQCYFRLAEHYYRMKNWSVALEYYVLLKQTGTKLNVLGRILTCQKELDSAASAEDFAEADLELIRQKAEENPGTAIAAEAEVFLLDRRLAPVINAKHVSAEIANEYRELLQKYSKAILATDNLEAYIHAQIGNAYFHGESTNEIEQAIAAYERSVEVSPSDENPYKRDALEHLALVAERAGDKERSVRAYNQLFQMSKQQLDQNKNDEELQQQTLEYLKSLVTRSDTGDLIEQSLQMCRDTIQQYGQLSDLSREARFYTGELYYLKKDFSSAAREFHNYIRIYGPEQNSLGDVHRGPWKPASVDAKVAQVYEAAIRIAHGWYLQGHGQNMVEAYQWIAKNMPHNNPHMAEVQYWLAMELSKGKEGKTRAAKRELAEALWKNVVNSSFDFRSGNFASSFHFWVKPNDERFASMQKYVKTACLRSGQLFGELKEHELAAGCFAQFIRLYPRAVTLEPKPDGVSPDDMYDIAHYALGRQYAELGYTDKLLDHYKAYTTGLRDSRFRVSALQLMGYHGGKSQRFDSARDAYATLLDEYGRNQLDEKGDVIPVPSNQRLSRGNSKWNGIRLAPPKGFDNGQIRYALGFLYWRQEEWSNCAVALTPFTDEKSLKEKESRAKALFMLGRSHFRLFEYEKGASALQVLLREHPRFDAIQEVYVFTARSLAEIKAWSELDLHYRRFVSEWPTSDRRPHMDLYAALSLLGQGQSARGLANLKSLADGETFEDVKADACYHLALNYQSGKPANQEAARQYFEKSVETFPRPLACLDGARCCIELQDWSKAQRMLDRLIRDFPDGDRRLVQEGRKLLPQVLKEIAKANEKQD